MFSVIMSLAVFSKLSSLEARIMSETILVTGGAGYIGSHTCKALAADGSLPVTLDNLYRGHHWAVKWGPFIEGDILDNKIISKAFEEYHPKAVIHFAALAYVGESVVDPGKYYNNNIIGTLSLLDAMRRFGCRHIIFSSTCSTFGIPDNLPINEMHPQKPINPYGHSKLMIEQILKDYEQAYGIKHVILRYFNAAGADPDSEIGEFHEPETHLIPLAIQTALGQHPHLKIFGTDYPTHDGTAIRDYIHVTDLADAHIRSLETLLESNRSFNLNLGNGKGYSVKEVISAVQEVSNKSVPIMETERRLGDPPILIADATKAFEMLGWECKHPDLKKIVESAFVWHRRHFSVLPTK